MITLTSLHTVIVVTQWFANLNNVLILFKQKIESIDPGTVTLLKCLQNKYRLFIPIALIHLFKQSKKLTYNKIMYFIQVTGNSINLM